MHFQLHKMLFCLYINTEEKQNLSIADGLLKYLYDIEADSFKQKPSESDYKDLLVQYAKDEYPEIRLIKKIVSKT